MAWQTCHRPRPSRGCGYGGLYCQMETLIDSLLSFTISQRIFLSVEMLAG